MSQLLFIRVYEGEELIAVRQFRGDQIIIGSEGESQLKLDDPSISPIHAMIERRADEYHLCDLGSEEGTKLNGQAVLDEVIESGDQIQIGDYTLEFFIGIPKPLTKPTEEKTSKPKEDLKKVEKPQEEIADEEEEKTHIVSIKDFEKETAHKEEKPREEKQTRESFVPPKPPAKPDEQTARPSDPIPTAQTEVEVDNRIIPVRESKKTYAPKSLHASVDEIIQPSKGSVVEVLVAWGDRILTTYHSTKKGVITFGSHPKNDIILPTLSSEQSSLPLLNFVDSEAKVFIYPFYKGSLYQSSGKMSLHELQNSGKVYDLGTNKAYALFQGEMMRLDMGEGISIYIRYVSPTPKPSLVPFLGFTSTEVSGLIIAFVIGGLIYIMSQLEPEKVEEDLPQEEIKITNFIFEKKFQPPPPASTPRPRPTPTPKPKKVTKMADKTAPLVKSVRDKSRTSGAAAEAKPNPSKSKKKKLTSDRKSKNNNRRVDRGGEKSNKNVNAGTTKRKDIKNTGLLGAFAKGGAQSQLAKANQGAGAISGLSQSATGEAGSGGDGPISEGLREVSRGGQGTAKIGAADIGTQGRGGGKEGYGSGDLGSKQAASIQIQTASLESDGSIDKAAILRVIRRNRSQILNCYEKELNKQPNLYGTVKVNWEILQGGVVGKIRIAESTLRNKRVENCIMTRFKAWRFPEPPPNQIAELYFPFVFTAK